MKPKAIHPVLIEETAASHHLEFAGERRKRVAFSSSSSSTSTSPPPSLSAVTKQTNTEEEQYVSCSSSKVPYFKFFGILFILHAIYSCCWDPAIIQFFRKTAVGQLGKAVTALQQQSKETSEHLGVVWLNLIKTFCFIAATSLLHIACYAVLALLLLPLPSFLRKQKKIDPNVKRREEITDIGVGVMVSILSIVVVTFNTIIMRVGGDVFGMLRAESVFIETSFTDAFLVSWVPVAFRSILTAVSLSIALLLFSVHCYKRLKQQEEETASSDESQPWLLAKLQRQTELLAYGAKHPLLLKYSILLVLLGVIALSSMLCKNFEHLPSVYSVPITLLYYYLFKLPTKVPKENLLLKPTQAPLANHIILIVDESIRAEYLSINNKILKQDTTPFLKTLNPINFGVSTSSFTCSCYSNYVIRNGVTLDDIKSLYSMQEPGNAANNVVDYSYQFSNSMHFDENLKKMLRRPSIFQYAANANLSTLMVNAQKKHGALHSFMHPTELQHIHDYRTTFLDNTRCSDHGDCTITSSIMSHLTPKANTSTTNAAGLNTFTLAVKLGLHWPYYWRYPSNISNAFEPSIFNSPLDLNTLSLNEIATRLSELANGKTGGMLDFMSDHEATLNSYLNGVKWNVDHFFQGLFDQIKQQGMKNYVIIYTSDHGQNVLGHNPLSNAFDGAVSDENRITHCRDVDAPSEQGEASVPMMIFTDNEELRSRFSRAAERKLDKTTHFEIFPTLMELMGYDHSLVKKMYGTSLLDEQVTNPQEYFTGSLFWRIKKHTFEQ